MTDHPDVARVWLEDLAARGITPEHRNGRIRFDKWAYRSLTPQDHLMLHTHRHAIKDALVSGVLDRIAPSIPIVDRRRVRLSDTQPDHKPILVENCPFCHQTPCIGPNHHAYDALHPDVQAQRRQEEHLKEFWQTLGRANPRLAYALAFRELKEIP